MLQLSQYGVTSTQHTQFATANAKDKQMDVVTAPPGQIFCNQVRNRMCEQTRTETCKRLRATWQETWLGAGQCKLIECATLHNQGTNHKIEASVGQNNTHSCAMTNVTEAYDPC